LRTIRDQCNEGPFDEGQEVVMLQQSAKIAVEKVQIQAMNQINLMALKPVVSFGYVE
jgi:hypothetical protein